MMASPRGGSVVVVAVVVVVIVVVVVAEVVVLTLVEELLVVVFSSLQAQKSGSVHAASIPQASSLKIILGIGVSFLTLA